MSRKIVQSTHATSGDEPGLELDLDLAGTKADPSPTAAEDAWGLAQSIAERAWLAAESPRALDDFDKLHADLNQGLNWIAFRTDQMLRLTAEERRHELHQRLIYSRAEGVVDGNPQRAIMLAMRRGDLVAFDEDGKPLSKEYWAHRGFDWRQWPPIMFRWAEVLAAFPTSGPSVREVLSESLRANRDLTQEQAWKIVKDRCKDPRRQEIRDLWKTLGGSSKRGPKGPRKNCAAPLA
jgi:hypothetical protein